MRKPGSLLLLLAATAVAAEVYEEPRDLSLNAAGLDVLVIRAGAGRLRVSGVPGTGTIVAKALVRIPGADALAARRIVAADLVLTLSREGRLAVLEAQFAPGGLFDDPAGSVELEVTLPESMALEVSDGSGEIEVLNTRADLRIDDGSGSIRLAGIGGNVTVDDGSGDLSAEDVGGDLAIDDGSGEIVLREVEGNVRIEDGSGGIIVSGVGGDLEIPDAGSGGVEVSDVAGRVRRDGG